MQIYWDHFSTNLHKKPLTFYMLHHFSTQCLKNMLKIFNRNSEILININSSFGNVISMDMQWHPGAFPNRFLANCRLWELRTLTMWAIWFYRNVLNFHHVQNIKHQYIKDYQVEICRGWSTVSTWGRSMINSVDPGQINDQHCWSSGGVDQQCWPGADQWSTVLTQW